jgi:hypothetical protein
MSTALTQIGWLMALVIVSVTVVGCGKKSAKPATEQLQQSFEKADAAIKEEIVQANSAFRAGDYTGAIAVMDRVVQSQPIDEAQKQAVDALILQTRQAVQQNPKLNTPELYKASAELMQKVHGEN